MTVSEIVIFSLGFFIACLLGLIACRLIWVRAVRLTRARLERDRPETLRAFEARIAGAQARAAISIRELERALERERQISAQARLMADQMTSSSALALAERDDTQSSLVDLSDTLNTTRERLRENEESMMRRNTELADMRRDLSDTRQELSMRDDDVKRLNSEIESLRAELATHLAGEGADAGTVSKLAENGDASAMARAQIETLRETVRQLRAEKNTAEASAARARLLLDAQDDNQALVAAKTAFDQERAGLVAQIEALEQRLQNTARPTPHLVRVDGEELETPSLETPHLEAAVDAKGGTDLDGLRASIDAMTASLTAVAAVEVGAEDRINTLLDDAEDSGSTSNLVTSLVEARNKLRAKKKVAPTRKRPAANAKNADKATAPEKGAKAKKAGAKIAAATVSGSSAAPKRRSMPRASESDLNVI